MLLLMPFTLEKYGVKILKLWVKISNLIKWVKHERNSWKSTTFSCYRCEESSDSWPCWSMWRDLEKASLKRKKNGGSSNFSSMTGISLLLEWLVLVLGLVFHHHLPALTHSEGERSLDVLRISQLVHVLPEDLSKVWRHLLVKRDLHQLLEKKKAASEEKLEEIQVWKKINVTCGKIYF